MLVQACLNGPREPAEHPALPVTPEELSADAVACVHAGAGAIHLHPRDEDGRESLDGRVVDAVVRRVRETCGAPVGVTTGAWVEPDPVRRARLVGRWVEPDFASVNLSEPGAPEVIRALLEAGIGVEAGVWSVKDAERLRAIGLADRMTRVLIEVVEDQRDPGGVAEEIDAVLDRYAIAAPRLHHGEDATAWPVLRQALELGRDIRVGLEDMLRLPDGTEAPGNAALVTAAVGLSQ
jgi:uncharacterized protein (DUF849 family)